MTRNEIALLSLSNPLVTPEQLTTTSSRLDGVPADLEATLRFTGARLTQAAGILLHLPQELIARAILIYYRFYVGSEGGSYFINSLKDVSAASLYLTAKPSFNPVTTRSLLNVYAYLTSSASPLNIASQPGQSRPKDPSAYHMSENDYVAQRSTLLQTETIILRAISFTTQVVTPHHLGLTYLQTLGALPSPPTASSKALARRTLEHLNTALLSPQLLYLTHQPNALAVSAIYLAARETDISLTSQPWWEVFDVDREELGFLVVALRSCESFVESEKSRWRETTCPMSVEELREHLKKQDDAG